MEEAALARRASERRLDDGIVVKVIASATRKKEAGGSASDRRHPIEVVDGGELAKLVAENYEVTNVGSVRIPENNDLAGQVTSAALAVRFAPVVGATAEVASGPKSGIEQGGNRGGELGAGVSDSLVLGRGGVLLRLTPVITGPD